METPTPSVNGPSIYVTLEDPATELQVVLDSWNQAKENREEIQPVELLLYRTAERTLQALKDVLCRYKAERARSSAQEVLHWLFVPPEEEDLDDEEDVEDTENDTKGDAT